MNENEHVAEVDVKVRAAFEAGLAGVPMHVAALDEVRKLAWALRHAIRHAHDVGATKTGLARATGLSRHAIEGALDLTNPSEAIERINPGEGATRFPPATEIVRRGTS